MNRALASLVLLSAATTFSFAAEPAADFAAIDRRAQALQPTAEVRRMDEIGWARDIRHALALARESNRPVFLFTHDGRMNLGRC